jgi:hypothetical protein
MLSINNISINTFTIGDEIKPELASKQYYGDIHSDAVSFPHYKMYVDGQDLTIDAHTSEILSILNGSAKTNRLRVGHWNMYTNDDVLTIEHELAHSRVVDNVIHVNYNDMYMTEINIVPVEKMNIRLCYLIIDCHTTENASFACETIEVCNSLKSVVNRDGRYLKVSALYESNIFYMSKTIICAHFIDRNISFKETTFIDVDGFTIPIKISTQQIFVDELIDIRDDGSKILVNNIENPTIEMKYEARYVFKGNGVNVIDIDMFNGRYLTEKGFVNSISFFSKMYRYKYIIVHPENHMLYKHRSSIDWNDILVIS